jgi:hypothetical protein
MAFKRSVLVVMVPAVLVWLAIIGSAQSEERFKVRLTPVPIDATMRSTVTGLGSASAVLAGRKLSINGSFDGLQTPATVARLHTGVATGVRGSALADLIVSKANRGTITGSVDLTPEQIEDLRKGKFYIQIHSEKAPEGNLWGWVLR